MTFFHNPLVLASLVLIAGIAMGLFLQLYGERHEKPTFKFSIHYGGAGIVLFLFDFCLFHQSIMKATMLGGMMTAISIGYFIGYLIRLKYHSHTPSATESP